MYNMIVNIIFYVNFNSNHLVTDNKNYNKETKYCYITECLYKKNYIEFSLYAQFVPKI